MIRRFLFLFSSLTFALFANTETILEDDSPKDAKELYDPSKEQDLEIASSSQEDPCCEETFSSCPPSCPAPCPPLHCFQMYFGGGAGYGYVEPVDNVIKNLLEGDTASLFDFLLAGSGGSDVTKDKAGGLAYRGTLGMLYGVTRNLSLGIEGGFTMYPGNKFNTLAVITGTDGVPSIVDLDIKSWAYGVDLLAVAQIYIHEYLTLALLPGFQLCRQKNLINQSITSPEPDNNSSQKMKTTVNRFCPEIMLKGGWNSSHIQLLLSYQHVFSTYSDKNSETISSRDWAGLELIFHF